MSIFQAFCCIIVRGILFRFKHFPRAFFINFHNSIFVIISLADIFRQKLFYSKPSSHSDMSFIRGGGGRGDFPVATGRQSFAKGKWPYIGVNAWLSS